uniref:SAM domain-containing protein n=1 Tax=Stomoxys calcitrans TaxID=35570 RepID=A0A1I8NT11_STOCA
MDISVNVPAVQFESNKEFQTKGILNDGDSGFLRYRHKFVQPKGNTQANREILTTLLSTSGDNSSDFVEKLIAEDISYRDLASLTQEDLELMGFNKRKQQELLSFFAQLPNQDPSYAQICQLKEAYAYNRKIVSNANHHLETMRSALAATNYKLQIMPPVDVIVGEKYFASRFVLEALNELYSATDDVEKEMEEIEQMILKKNQQNSTAIKAHKKPQNKIWRTSYFLWSSITSLGICIALYYWKLRK